MSFTSTSLTFVFIVFNFVPAFVFGTITYYKTLTLTEEGFDAESGISNWKKVQDNPQLEGKSPEAKEYIQDLRDIQNVDNTLIMGANLWTIRKNIELDKDYLRRYGFTDSFFGNLKNTVTLDDCTLWEPEFANVLKAYASYFNNWRKENEKNLRTHGKDLPPPLGTTDWLKNKYYN